MDVPRPVRRSAAVARKALASIAEWVRITRKLQQVPFVIAHEDCDAVESAHEVLSADIEGGLGACGVVAVAATPAWEMEALFQWPDALVAVHGRWRRPSRDHQHVGRIEHAKEQLRRDLRPKARGARDYRESDSPRVVEQAVRLGLLDKAVARSDSYRRFVERLAAVVGA